MKQSTIKWEFHTNFPVAQHLLTHLGHLYWVNKIDCQTLCYFLLFVNSEAGYLTFVYPHWDHDGLGLAYGPYLGFHVHLVYKLHLKMYKKKNLINPLYLLPPIIDNSYVYKKDNWIK